MMLFHNLFHIALKYHNYLKQARVVFACTTYLTNGIILDFVFALASDSNWGTL